MSKIALLKWALYVLVITVLGIMIIQFVNVNPQLVEVQTFLGPIKGFSIGAILMSVFVLGGITGFMVAFIPSIFDLVKIRQLRAQLKSERKRVHELKKQQSTMAAHADLPNG